MKDLIVNFTKSQLMITIRGQEEPYLQGEFAHEIKVEETTWVIEDGRYLLLTIEKVCYY